MSSSRIFTIDVDADQEESSSESEETTDFTAKDNLRLLDAEFGNLFAEIDKKRAQFLETLQEGYVAPPVRKEIISADKACYFIQSETSVQEFYDYVTHQGSDFNYCLNARESRGGYTVLIAACAASNFALVSALLAAGVSPNQCTKTGERSLDFAVAEQNERLIGLLTSAGAKRGVEIYADYISKLRSQLLDAVVANDIVATKTLLAEHQNEIDLPSVVIKMSRYCTRQAVMSGNLDFVKLLAEHGDDYMEIDGMNEKSNIEVAKEAGFDEIADYLEQKQREVYQQLHAQIQVEKPQATTGTTHAFFSVKPSVTTTKVENFSPERPGW